MWWLAVARQDWLVTDTMRWVLLWTGLTSYIHTRVHTLIGWQVVVIRGTFYSALLPPSSCQHLVNNVLWHNLDSRGSGITDRHCHDSPHSSGHCRHTSPKLNLNFYSLSVFYIFRFYFKKWEFLLTVKITTPLRPLFHIYFSLCSVLIYLTNKWSKYNFITNCSSVFRSSTVQ